MELRESIDRFVDVSLTDFNSVAWFRVTVEARDYIYTFLRRPKCPQPTFSRLIQSK